MLWEALPRCSYIFFFFNDTATTEIYTLSLHDALPIYSRPPANLCVLCGSAFLRLVQTALFWSKHNRALASKSCLSNPSHRQLLRIHFFELPFLLVQILPRCDHDFHLVFSRCFRGGQRLAGFAVRDLVAAVIQLGELPRGRLAAFFGQWHLRHGRLQSARVGTRRKCF